MEIKKIALSLVLLSSIVALKSFSMEKENNGKRSVNNDWMFWTEEMAENEEMMEDIEPPVNKGQALPTAVCHAVLDNDIEKVKAFLDAGGDVNSVHKGSGSHLLAMAANEGRTEIVDLLVKRGADIYKEQNADFGRFTAFDWALLGDRYEIVKILIDNGFDVNGEGPRGFPLKLAYGKSVELLLAQGANLNKLTSKNIPVWLDAIINRKNEESAINIHHKQFSDMLKLWHKYGAHMRFQDKNGRTVLFYLIDNGCINLITCLCELDLDIVNIPDNQGMLPFDYAKKYFEHYKKSYMQDLTKVEHKLLNQGRLISVLKKAYAKKARKEAKKQVDERFGSKEMLDLYKEIFDFLGEKNLKKIQDLKKIKFEDNPVK